MKINENKWVSVGSIQDFVNNKSPKAVDPYFDWFISSLAVNIDNYNLSQHARANLTSFIYLLLNTQFQSKVKKIRDYFDIPSNGFENEKMFNAWRNILYQAVIDYQNKKKIPLKQNRIITFIEKQAIKLTAGKVSSSFIFNNLEDTVMLIFMRLLKIGKDRNGGLWGNFFYHLIITFNPEELFDNLLKFYWKNEVYFLTDDFFDSINLVVPLTLNSTINSIQTTIEKNKTKILQTIEEMKTKSPKTGLQAREIERDYALYKSYIPFKTTKAPQVRKEDHAFEEAEKYYHFDTQVKQEDYNVEAIRKIVDRMKDRIRESFIDKSDAIANLLAEIENTTPTPYPEYVKNRS